MLIIDKKYTGLENNIEINYLNYIWEDINTLLALENITHINSIDKEYAKLLKNLNLNYHDVNWLSLLGKQSIRKNLNLAQEKINILKNKFDISYEDTLYKRYKLTNEIVGCYFKENNYDIPLYDHVSSSTGRSKISQGVNFLVMKKEDRRQLSSSFKKGAIYEIDIVSLEPRFFLKYFKDISVNDVYMYIANKILNNSSSRKKIKLGMLATIYGAGYGTVKKLSGLSKKDYERIIDYFNVKKIKEELLEKFNTDEKIKNSYGRNLYSNTSILNHFIQSSSADCAYRAFHNFYFSNEDKFNLIAVIHDAIIIDVPFENITMIENTYCIKEDKLNIDLPVTVRRIS
jgi:hypothetical protein